MLTNEKQKKIEEFLIFYIVQSLLPSVRIFKNQHYLFYDEHYQHCYKTIGLKYTFDEILECVKNSDKLYYYETNSILFIGPNNGIGFIYYQFCDDVWFGKFPANKDFNKIKHLYPTIELREKFL